MIASLSLVATSLLACAPGGNFISAREVSCESNPYSWFGGLAHYADMGKTSQGVISFDLTPSQSYIGSISGSYNSSSGVFSWVTNYSDYFLVSESVEGYGSIYPNGAADTLYTARTLDILDDGWTRTWREERYGCEGYQQVWTEHEAEEEGEESDWSLNSELDYTILSPDEVSFFWEGDGLQRDGAWRSDYSERWTEVSLDGSWQSDSQRDAAGQLTEDFVLETSYRYEGRFTLEPSGLQRQEYTIYDDDEALMEVRAEFGYDGDGSAVWIYENGTECDVLYEAGECSYDCDDGSAGSC